jgi:hypothetical protein
MSHPRVSVTLLKGKTKMAKKSGGNALYFIIGAVVVAVIAVGFFMVQESNEPDFSIDVSESGIDVETN